MSGIQQMLGSGPGYYITFVNDGVQATATSPSTANARYTLEADGDIVKNAVTDAGDWISPKSLAGGNFECRAANVTGDGLSSGPTTYTALSSSQTWSRQQSVVGGSSCSFDVQLRRVGTTAPVYTVAITLTATVEI